MTTMGQTWDQLVASNPILPVDCLVRTLTPTPVYRRGDGNTRFNSLPQIKLNPMFSMLWDMSLANQAALSSISASSGQAVQTAQATADGAAASASAAQTSANQAQSTASSAGTAAAAAQSTANQAQTNAASAQSAANTAQSTASNAQTSATAAGSAASAAQSTADTAKANAATAQTTANTAQTAASAAQSSANAAQSTANTGVTNAAAAQSTANTAVTNAASAQTRADNAYALALAGQNLPTTAIKSQVAVTNTVTETTLITMSPTSIAAGATFRIKAAGTISAAVLSSSLTFKLYLGSTSAPQTLVLNGTLLGSLTTLVPFSVEYIATARTTGLYIATGSGRVNATVLGAGAATTTALSGTTVKLTAQWAAAATGSSLLVETATVEQIV